MGETNEQKFNIETILSITTGRKFTDMENIRKALCYLTGCELSPFELTSAAEVAKNYILENFPQLKGVDASMDFVTPGEATHFVDEQRMIYGNAFALAPLPEGSFKKMTDEELVNGFAGMMKEELARQLSELEQNKQ